MIQGDERTNITPQWPRSPPIMLMGSRRRADRGVGSHPWRSISTGIVAQRLSIPISSGSGTPHTACCMETNPNQLHDKGQERHRHEAEEQRSSPKTCAFGNDCKTTRIPAHKSPAREVTISPCCRSTPVIGSETTIFSCCPSSSGPLTLQFSQQLHL